MCAHSLNGGSMSRAEKIAILMADRAIRNSGTLTKSAGTRQQLARECLPVAEGIVQGIKPFEKALRKVLAAQGGRLEDNDGRMRGNDQFRDGGSPRGSRELKPTEFEVRPRTLPKLANGSDVLGRDDRKAPFWHPEAN